MSEDELRDLYNNDYDTNFEFGEFCYNKGRADEQEFVEKRCKELGIDYILIYTCDSAD